MHSCFIFFHSFFITLYFNGRWVSLSISSHQCLIRLKSNGWFGCRCSFSSRLLLTVDFWRLKKLCFECGLVYVCFAKTVAAQLWCRYTSLHHFTVIALSLLISPSVPLALVQMSFVEILSHCSALKELVPLHLQRVLSRPSLNTLAHLSAPHLVEIQTDLMIDREEQSYK